MISYDLIISAQHDLGELRSFGVGPLANLKNPLQGGSVFSELTTAKWIFDVEIKILRAEVFFTSREEKSHAWLSAVSTDRLFENKILSTIFKFSELIFFSDLLLSVLFTQAQPIPIQSSKYSISSNLPLLSVGVLFVLCVASLGEILYLDRFLVAATSLMLYLGQNRALLSPVSTNRALESKNYKHEKTGARSIFLSI